MRLDTDIEKGNLRSTIDRFFGTVSGGYREIKEIMNAGTKNEIIISKANKSQLSVYERCRELGLMICGGTVNSIFTGNPVNDLDFYMTRDNSAECLEFLKSYFPDVKGQSINAVTLQRKAGVGNKRYTVQLVIRFIGEPKDIFNWFDFTITHGAFDFRSEEFVFGDRFFPDLAKRRLVYSGSSKYPICAMYRTKKYQERGYTVSGATIMHIAISIVQLKIANYAELKEQLMGIDTMYLQKVLDTKNPENTVDYGEFVEEAFKTIDSIGQTLAEEAENEH